MATPRQYMFDWHASIKWYLAGYICSLYVLISTHPKLHF